MVGIGEKVCHELIFFRFLLKCTCTPYGVHFYFIFYLTFISVSDIIVDVSYILVFP